MTSPPGGTPTTSNSSLTDLSANRPRRNRTRSDSAKARDRMTRTPLHRRVAGMMRRGGMEPEAWQVESVTATLVANREDPTDEQLTAALMKAPWFPKPQVRRWQVGEGGGWAVRS